MHDANRQFWATLRAEQPGWFTGRRVLEVGSFNVNGSVRDYFSACDYTGIDWRPGPGVDVVTLAHEAVFAAAFDTVISASMLEHDPYWPDSLRRMVELTADTGVLLLSWGAAENAEHNNETAPDGAFHALPAGCVVELLERSGMRIVRRQYDAEVLPGAGWGEINVVAVWPTTPDVQIAGPVTPLRELDRV